MTKPVVSTKPNQTSVLLSRGGMRIWFKPILAQNRTIVSRFATAGADAISLPVIQGHLEKTESLKVQNLVSQSACKTSFEWQNRFSRFTLFRDKDWMFAWFK